MPGAILEHVFRFPPEFLRDVVSILSFFWSTLARKYPQKVYWEGFRTISSAILSALGPAWSLQPVQQFNENPENTTVLDVISHLQVSLTIWSLQLLKVISVSGLNVQISF